MSSDQTPTKWSSPSLDEGFPTAAQMESLIQVALHSSMVSLLQFLQRGHTLLGQSIQLTGR